VVVEEVEEVVVVRVVEEHKIMEEVV